MRAILSLFALLLAGCAAQPKLPNNSADLSPEQIKAMVSDRSASVSCASFDALLYGKSSAVAVTVDRSTIPAGELVVQCGDSVVTLTVAPK